MASKGMAPPGNRRRLRQRSLPSALGGQPRVANRTKAHWPGFLRRIRHDRLRVWHGGGPPPPLRSHRRGDLHMAFIGLLLLAAAAVVAAGIIMDNTDPSHLTAFGQAVPGIDNEWQV